MSIRRPSRLTLALAAALFAGAALAQADKPLRIVVPFAAGGSQDVIARYLGSKIGARLGFPVIVDNKAGAGGIVAADYVAKSTDGATLLMATGGAITVAPHLQKLPYDPQRDLQSVALVADTPMTLAVRSDSPYRKLADLLGGQVSMIITSAASIEPMVASGKARVLGTFSKERLMELGHPPTVNDASGLKGMDVPVWVGLMGPVHTPPERLDRIVAALIEACRLPETREQFARIGAVNTCGGKAEMEKVLAQDYARWDKVIRTGGIKVE